MGFFAKTLDKLKGALKKTAEVLNTDVRTLFIPGRQIDDAFLGEMEEKFLQADMGVKNVETLVTEVRDRWRLGKIRNAAEAEAERASIKEQMVLGWGTAGQPGIAFCTDRPDGDSRRRDQWRRERPPASPSWRGCSKTEMNKKVMVCASDTFRAAAVDQLTIWADRLGVEIVKHKMGADPAAVAYDACEAAKSRGIDVLIVDTAGRLHTQDNLMRELTKIRDVVAKRIENAPHEVLLVLDATTGQNAIAQAKNFGKAINVTGLILAKLDGTAKGGMVIAIRDQLNIPVKFIGLGETPQDIETFDPQRFVDALFAEKF